MAESKFQCFTFYDPSYLKTLPSCKDWDLHFIDYNWSNLVNFVQGNQINNCTICLLLNEHYLTLRDNLEQIKRVFDSFKIATKVIVMLTPAESSIDSVQYRKLNELLLKIESQTQVAIIRENELLSYQEKLPLFDRRLFCLNECPFSFEFQAFIGNLLKQIYEQVSFKKKRLIILDLDDTLWGGLLAEQNFQTLEVGPASFTSRIFSFVQRELHRFYLGGGLLAICSKNHPEEVLECLEQHPGLILRNKHFAVIKAGWKPKSDYIKEILIETGITEDYAVFLDDSEFERNNVKKLFPNLFIPTLPSDHAKLPNFYRELVGIRQFFTSEQDKNRTLSIQKNLERKAVNLSNSNPAEGLPPSDSSIEINLLSTATSSGEVQRCSDLINKTNQFNTTSLRISLDQLLTRIQNKSFRYFSVSYKDAFINEGIIGVLGIETTNSTLKVIHFLLSCRVLGRNIEWQMLAEALKHRPANQEIEFELKPTPKNKLAQSFLKFLQDKQINAKIKIVSSVEPDHGS